MARSSAVVSGQRLLNAEISTFEPTWRDDMITALLARFIIFGLFIDGWAHLNLYGNKLGGFFTPWHGILYAGFGATSIWIITRIKKGGLWKLGALPAGYGLAVTGMVLATAALVGDLTWHTIFGEEVGIARLLAPFHLVLALGAGLVISTPLRAGLLSRRGPANPTFRQLMPVLLSVSLVTALAAFFFQYASVFVTWVPGQSTTIPETTVLGQYIQIVAALSVLLMNLVITAPVLFLMKRWNLPFGSVTFLFTAVAGLNGALSSWTHWHAVAAAAIGGIAADIMIKVIKPSAANVNKQRLVAGLLPIPMWSIYFIVTGISGDVSASFEVASGLVVMTGMSSLAMSLLVMPHPTWSMGAAPAAPQASSENPGKPETASWSSIAEAFDHLDDIGEDYSSIHGDPDADPGIAAIASKLSNGHSKHISYAEKSLAVAELKRMLELRGEPSTGRVLADYLSMSEDEVDEHIEFNGLPKSIKTLVAHDKMDPAVGRELAKSLLSPREKAALARKLSGDDAPDRKTVQRILRFVETAPKPVRAAFIQDPNVATVWAERMISAQRRRSNPSAGRALDLRELELEIEAKELEL